MNNLNRILLRRLKSKHQKLSTRFLKGIEEGNFQQLNSRKKFVAVERLKKIERQLKDLGLKTGNRINISLKHWAVALALGIIVTSSSVAQNKEPKTKFFQRAKAGTNSKPEAQNVFFLSNQQLGETFPYNLLVGDIDGDGDDDAIYISYLDNPIVLTNEGAFTFSQSNIFRNSNEVVQFAGLDDIDGDGDLDLIMIKGSYYTAPITSAYLNDGLGVFTFQSIDLGGVYLNPNQAELGDFDGDGDLDIAFVNYSYVPPQVDILENNNFVFTPLSTASPLVDVSSIFATGDMDGDSDIDILYMGNNGSAIPGLRIFENDGVGNFTDSGMEYSGYFDLAEVGDIDNDSDLDIILSTSSYPNVNVTQLIQASANVFTPGALLYAYGASGGENLTVTDLDGDGNDDIFLYGQDGKSHVFANTGSAVFASEQVINGDIRSANLDGNSDIDLFIFDGDLGTYENQGSFTFFRNPSDIINVGSSEDIDLVDIDNDGDLDVVQGKHPTVWLNDGTGNFIFQQKEKGYHSYKHVFGDLDGDSDPDMIALPKGTDGPYQGFSIWRTDLGNIIFNNNIGNSVFETSDIALANMDGDSDLDIVVTIREGSTQHYLRTYLNQGGFSFSLGANLPLAARNFLAVGDVDGDTDIDVMVMYNNDITTYLNDGSGNLTNSSTVTASGGNMQSKELKLADLDGDSNLDIFVPMSEEGGSYASYIFINNGSGVFTEDPTGVDSGSAYHSAIGDLDRDGDNDIITTGYSSGIQVFLNDGAGVFTKDDVDLGKGEESTIPAIGDLDGDSDIDVVIGGYYIANRVWFNGRAIEGDSLALTAFYNATDGPNWTDNSNWLSGSVDSWAGITVTGDRVTDISLPDNNVSGIVPAEFEDLSVVTSVDLSGNAIEGFESNLIGLSSIINFDVSDNKLDFGDFELIGGVTGLVIGNQSTNDQAINDLIPAGDPTSFSFTVDGSNTDYQWFKNGATLAGAITNTIDITSIDRSNMGDYYCEATDINFPTLTLTSATKTVLATATINGQLSISDTAPATDGQMLLLKITTSDGFDTTAVAPITTAGLYEIQDVILDDYLLVGIADTITHVDAIPTYYSITDPTVFWLEADTLFINGNVTADITAQFSTNPAGDIGSFFGYLEQEVPEGGRTEGRTRVSDAGVAMRRGTRDGRTEGSGELVHYVYTNSNGDFNIQGIAPGEYNVDIQYPGYPMDETSFLDVTIGSGEKDKSVSVEALVDKGVITVRQLIILGTDEVENGLLLFPNPTKDFLQIQDAENRDDLTVKIFNTSGKELKSISLAGIDKIRVADLPVGQYIVTISDDQGKELLTRKIIIQY